MKEYNFCNNCGKHGHLFHQCKNPITSIGIIVFNNDGPKTEYLMIRRKDSLGYVDFMRGKYPLFNKRYLLNIINEMTIIEKNKLLTFVLLRYNTILLVVHVYYLLINNPNKEMSIILLKSVLIEK